MGTPQLSLLLSAVDVPEYLLAHGLLSPRSIIDSDVVIRELSGRNRTFGAECRNAPSYLLKQNTTAETNAASEGDVYRALSATASMRPYLAQFHGYDADGRILVTEYFPAGEDLASFHLRRSRPPARTASAIGTVLAALHRVPVEQAGPIMNRRRRSPALAVHRPGRRLVTESSRTAMEVVKIIQGTDGFGAQLDALHRDWSATTPVHQDVRFKNFVWTPPSSTSSRPRLKLIDWELACLGDPAWDIGSALGNYLSLWLTSIPATGSYPVAQSAELARCPLSGVQRAIRACWHAYVKVCCPDDAGAALLPRTVRYAAARLVQTTFETAQDSTSLTADMVLHLQVAFNMLQRPREAASHLLGVTSPELPGGDA